MHRNSASKSRELRVGSFLLSAFVLIKAWHGVFIPAEDGIERSYSDS